MDAPLVASILQNVAAKSPKAQWIYDLFSVDNSRARGCNYFDRLEFDTVNLN
jgi:hypothetical protein